MQPAQQDRVWSLGTAAGSLTLGHLWSGSTDTSSDKRGFDFTATRLARTPALLRLSLGFDHGG